MARADGKLYELLADEVCRAILRALLERDEPITQRTLTAELAYGSSTISRRMGDLEDAGLVARSSAHAPYFVLFRAKTRELLLAGADLAHMAHEGLADDAARDARELRKEHMVAQSPRTKAEDSA
jgi:DNA-binding MarR family transcriptional regulator